MGNVFSWVGLWTLPWQVSEGREVLVGDLWPSRGGFHLPGLTYLS